MEKRKKIAAQAVVSAQLVCSLELIALGCWSKGPTEFKHSDVTRVFGSFSSLIWRCPTG